MHIVHCLTHSKIGGGQAVPYLMVKSFLTYYPRVTHSIVLPKDGIYVHRFRNLNVPVFELPLDTVNPVTLLHASTLINKLQPDVIHTHGRGAGLYFRTLKKNLRLRVHTHHGFHLPEDQLHKWFFISLEKYLTTETDKLIAMSQSETEIIARTIPNTTDKIVVIPNLVDADDVRKRSLENLPEQFEQVKKSTEGKFVVTLLGRNDPVKNYPLAIESAFKILRKTNKIYFLFIGLEESNAVLKTLNAEYPQHFCATGIVENPYPFLAVSNLLLMTSKREAGPPLVLLEAQSLGIPFIGTNVRGIAEGIEHNQNGLLVEEDSDAVAHAVLQCIQDRHLYDRLKTGTKTMAKQNTLEQWCAKYYQLYNS